MIQDLKDIHECLTVLAASVKALIDRLEKPEPPQMRREDAQAVVEELAQEGYR